MNVNNLVSSAYPAQAPIARSVSLTASRGNTSSSNSRVSGGVATYDFTNMSPEQLGNTVNQLLSQGKMTVDQSTVLAGMAMMGRNIAQYSGSPPASFYQPVNVLQDLQTQLQGAISRGDSSTEYYTKRALDLLNSLQGTTSSVDLYA